MRSDAIDITGMRFGRLLVIKRAFVFGKTYKWLCKCDCGKEHYATSGNLRNVKAPVRSCGCLRMETRKMNTRTHGECSGGKATFEYATWRGIKARIFNPKSTGFKYWGGRGIGMCERWRVSYANFLADMGRHPEGTSLERVNNDKDYEPGNCVWATRVEQNNNKRSNVIIEHEGKRMNTTQWAKLIGVDPGTIRARLNRGWPPSKALDRFMHKPGPTAT